MHRTVKITLIQPCYLNPLPYLQHSPNTRKMFIKLVFKFFLFVIFSKTLAQPNLNSYICENVANYTTNSMYQTNLGNTLSDLPSTNNGFGFFNLSTGQGSDRVNSAALCRGDVETDMCLSCLNDSIIKLREACPNQKEAVGYYSHCLLKYSNTNVLGNTQIKAYRYKVNSQSVLSNRAPFIAALSSLMNQLEANAAAGGPLKKYASGNTTTGPDFTRIYGLVQCTPDLSETQCKNCVENAKKEYEVYYIGRIGGTVYLPMCRYSYDIFQFFNGTTLETISPPPPPYMRDKNSKMTRSMVIVIVTVSVCVIIIIAFICIFMRLRKKKQISLTSIEAETMDIGNIESLKYDYSIVREATNDFSEHNKLGQGGFGPVYKGMLKDGQEIAVKRLGMDSRQGDIEFKNEVLLVAKLQHRNLVKLLGYSLEGSERLLIYEYLPNSSLDQFIFDPIRRTFLDWDMRYKIIIGIGKGLLYLHEDSRLRIIHRDMKASNILLDIEMNPKISDFGMARLFKQEEIQGDTNRIVGTYGYMAPEYAMHGRFSIKSDVFSFGVLLLEIIAGQKNQRFQNGESIEYLLSFAWKSWKNGTTIDIIDPTLTTGSGSLHGIIRSIQIGLLCVQEKVSYRPTMSLVVHMLNSFSLILPEPSEPAFIMCGNIDSEMTFRNEHNSNVNDISVSEIYPR